MGWRVREGQEMRSFVRGRENAEIGPVAQISLDGVVTPIRDIKIAAPIEHDTERRIQPAAREEAKVGSIRGKFLDRVTGVVGDVNVAAGIKGKSVSGLKAGLVEDRGDPIRGKLQHLAVASWSAAIGISDVKIAR